MRCSDSSLLPTDKGEGGQKTGGPDDRSPGGINSKEAPDSNPSLLPTDKGGGGQKTGGRDDRSPGGINSKEAQIHTLVYYQQILLSWMETFGVGHGQLYRTLIECHVDCSRQEKSTNR